MYYHISHSAKSENELETGLIRITSGLAMNSHATVKERIINPTDSHALNYG